MTIEELKYILSGLGETYDNAEVVIRQYGTSETLKLEVNTSISPTNKTFELITKDKIK